MRKPFRFAQFLIVTSLLAASCVTLEQAAPPVKTLSLSADTGATDQLEEGRALYVTTCARCHSVVPVHKYPLTVWDEKVFPEMTRKAKLHPEELAALRAYVQGVLASPGTAENVTN